MGKTAAAPPAQPTTLSTATGVVVTDGKSKGTTGQIYEISALVKTTKGEIIVVPLSQLRPVESPGLVQVVAPQLVAPEVVAPEVVAPRRSRAGLCVPSVAQQLPRQRQRHRT